MGFLHEFNTFTDKVWATHYTFTECNTAHSSHKKQTWTLKIYKHGGGSMWDAHYNPENEMVGRMTNGEKTIILGFCKSLPLAVQKAKFLTFIIWSRMAPAAQTHLPSVQAVCCQKQFCIELNANMILLTFEGLHPTATFPLYCSGHDYNNQSGEKLPSLTEVTFNLKQVRDYQAFLAATISPS